MEGSIRLKARGDLGGWMHSGIEAEGLDVTWLTLLARQLRGSDSEPGLAPGRAEDLGTLFINTFGGSLDGQLQASGGNRDVLLRPMPWLIPARALSWSVWKGGSICRERSRVLIQSASRPI